MARNKREYPGDWKRLPHTWYRVTGGTEFWLPEPPADAQFVAPHLFYIPSGGRALHKNNSDAWVMLVVNEAAGEEKLGQEIAYFNRVPNDNAQDVPLEVAEDMVEQYNTLCRAPGEPELTMFQLNPQLVEHPAFNGGYGVLGAGSQSQITGATGGEAQFQQELAAMGYSGQPSVAEQMTQMPMSNHNQHDTHGWQEGPGNHMMESMGFAKLEDIATQMAYEDALAHEMNLGQQMPGERGRSNANQAPRQQVYDIDPRADEFFGVGNKAGRAAKGIPWWGWLAGTVTGLTLLGRRKP
jgi:hypothetical protein